MVGQRAPVFAQLALAALAVLLLVDSKASADPIRYSVTDLGTLPGGSLYEAFGINASGQVVGTYARNSLGRSFLYSGGKLTDTTDSGASGRGINNAGQMTKGGDVAINNVGQTVGMEYSPSLDEYYVNSNGVKKFLPSNTQPFAINDNGQIVGRLGFVSGGDHPFLYSNGRFIDLGLVSPVLNFGNTKATAINNFGEVVGGALMGPANAFLYNGSKLIDLGTLGGSWSTAQGINNLGQVVGMSALQVPPGEPNLHAFLYQNGSMLDLNALIPLNSGWVLTIANAINDSGQIVGYGDRNGQPDAFLLTPEVPEPSVLALIALLVGMCGVRSAAARLRPGQ